MQTFFLVMGWVCGCTAVVAGLTRTKTESHHGLIIASALWFIASAIMRCAK